MTLVRLRARGKEKAKLLLTDESDDDMEIINKDDL